MDPVNRGASSYRPAPISTSHIDLGAELGRLIERLAENNHDLWAEARLAEGWRYGPQRNDDRKEHPCLLPYQELPESEKEYDRAMAVETLKVILALGFQIQPPESALQKDNSGGAALAGLRVLRQQLASPRSLTVQELGAVWRARDERLWSTEPELYALLGERFLKLGDPLLAYEVVEAGLRTPSRWKPRLTHLLGLALARSGVTQRANTIATELCRAAPDDPALLEDALGLLGRTHKDLALEARDTAERTWHLERALAAYGDAFRRTGGSYSSINAATVALLLGREQEAASLAGAAREAALRELRHREQRGEDTHWQLATLAEAALILREIAGAERHYRDALQQAGERYGDIASMRRQARLLASSRDLDLAWLNALLRVPRVAVFAGHMVDRPDQDYARFPPSAEHAIAEAIHDRLRQLNVGFGFSAAACGSDILFLEAMARLNGRTTIVLPYAKEQFIRTSVDLHPDGNWVARFHRVLDDAAEVVVASGSGIPGSDVLFDYGNLLMLGLATMQSQWLETELVPMVVWDEQDSAGVTAAVVRQWRDAGHRVEVIPLPMVPENREAAAHV